MVWGTLGDQMENFIIALMEKKLLPLQVLLNWVLKKYLQWLPEEFFFDMTKILGVEYLKAGQTFSVKELKLAEKQQGVKVKKGDVVLFHTGWTDAMLEKFPEKWGAEIPGLTPELAQYLADAEVIAVGSDTYGLDVIPPVNPMEPFQGHVILLKENGIYILEAMNTGPLARDETFEFLFVLGQAKVRGAVQMYVNPIAIR